MGDGIKKWHEELEEQKFEEFRKKDPRAVFEKLQKIQFYTGRLHISDIPMKRNDAAYLENIEKLINEVLSNK
jgi:hypothetical protein